MKQIKLLMVAFLAMIGSSAYAADYIIDQRFTSIAELDGKLFTIVNEADGKAVYNSDNQNLKYDTYSAATSGASYQYVLESLAGESDEAIKGCYTLKAVKADGSNVSFWGNSAVYLNSGAPSGFNGCFILGNNDEQYGTDVKYGGVWEVEYVDGNGFTLKNKAIGGYFAGPTSRPESETPIYWTFCTLKKDLLSDYNDLKAKVLALDDDATVFAEDSATVDISAAEAAATAATNEEEVNAAMALLKEAAINFITSVTINEGKAFDMTAFWLVNPDFEVPANNGAMPTGWTITITGQNCGQQNRTDTNSETGLAIKNFIEAWHPSALGPGVIAQTVSDLPEGTYRLECDASVCHDPANGDGSDITGAYIFIKSSLKTEQEPVGTARLGIKHFSVSFSHGGSGEVQFGLMATNEINANWLSADNFKIYYAGGVDLSIYEDALAEAVVAAKAVDQTAPMQATVLADLQSAIAAAEGTTFTTKDEINDAISAMNDAVDAANASISLYATNKAALDTYAAKVAAFDAAGQAAYDVQAIVDAYTNGTLDTDKSADIKAAYIAALKVAGPVVDITDLASASWVGQTGNVAEWACPDAPGSPERYQAGAFTGDVMTQTITGLQNGTYKVKMIGGASYTSDRGFDGAVGQNHAYFFANDALQSLEVYDRASIGAGTIETAELTCGVKDGTLKFGIQNITIGANWFVIRLESITYVSTDLPKTDVTLAVGEAKYATFIAPFEYEVPAGVKAYTVDAVDADAATLVMTEKTTVPANTPVVLYAESPVSTTVSGVSEAASQNYTVGLLTGVYGETEITAGYVLQNQAEDGVKFYAVSAENPKTVPANHAYLTVPAGSEVKAFGFDAIATAIQNIEVAKAAQNGAIFNLAGQQLNGLQKGINIVNGKKVLVK